MIKKTIIAFMFLSFLWLLINNQSCYCQNPSKNISDTFRVVSIKRVKHVYVICLEKNGVFYRAFSEKGKRRKVKKIRKGESYYFELKTNNSDIIYIYSPNLPQRVFDVNIPYDDCMCNQKYIIDNLDGLYYLPAK